MTTFRVALTGDFLDDRGQPAYGGYGLELLAQSRHIEYSFIAQQRPRAGDQAYWDNLYSMHVTADDLRNVHGLIVLRPWVQRPALEAAADELVVIGRSGAGFDKIDVSACTELGIAVFNVPRALDHSTASTALMFMLALAKRLSDQQHAVRTGRWDLQPQIMGSELTGRTLGIIGLGQSGRELARLVAPFPMRILAYSPHADSQVAESLGVSLTSLESLLRESDFVSLHARLRPDNHQLLGRRELALMKPTAYLVNVARGELIEQAALVEALRTGRLAGAALDVFEQEPLPRNDPLLELSNVILTPHWSASTVDIWRTTGEATARGMLQTARGEVPDNLVNPEVGDNPLFVQKLTRFAPRNHQSEAAEAEL
jgi:phosphoglycerate dehydrogenase-like enzyme